MYMGLHTRATAAPIVLLWCSVVKTYSPEAPSYKTTISFQTSTVQHTVLCCVAGFMAEAWGSPTWKANSSSASQEISSILCSPQVRHRVHNSPPPVHTLSTRPLTHHVHLGLPSGLIPSGFSTKSLNTVLSRMCHVFHPSALLDLITRILYYFARSTNLEAHHYAVFSSVL